MKLIQSIIDEKIKTIAVDFDGTLCEREKFPKIGSPKTELIEWLIEQKKKGIKIILWSCRENDDLFAAIDWCKEYGLEFDAVNENHSSCNLETRKVVADIYIDDRACLPIYEDKI